jgi:hypothetical protein
VALNTNKTNHHSITELLLRVVLNPNKTDKQCVTEPTREKNISALVLTTNENLVHKVDVMNGMSDHQMIITTINARPKIIRNKPRKVYLS